PNELRLLIAGIETGYDICMGSRFLTGGGTEDMPLIRKIGNKLFILLVNFIFKTHYTDLCYGYRSFTKDALRKLNLKEDKFGIETEISIKAAKLGLKVLEVPSLEKKRKAGEANSGLSRTAMQYSRQYSRTFRPLCGSFWTFSLPKQHPKYHKNQQEYYQGDRYNYN
ncbi:MAG: hypothetical protein ACP5HF_03680, partial [Candidatus Micrarchaeia archaeon]